MQHVPKGWNTSVMQIRSRGPDAIERWRDITIHVGNCILTAKIGEPAFAVVFPMFRTEGVEPDSIGADVVDRNPYLWIVGICAIRSVARGAVVLKDQFAPL